MVKPVGSSAIARWMHHLGLSINELAEDALMDPFKLRRIVNGSQDPKSRDLEAIAMALEIDISTLFHTPTPDK